MVAVVPKCVQKIPFKMKVGVVGENEYCRQSVRAKVDVWVGCVDKLYQAAFASLTKSFSLQCEWDFLQRVVPDCADAFKPLNEK